MSTSFKKNELIDLLTVLGLRASAKSVKAKLEADIVKHLSTHPGDVRLDERLSEFTDKAGEDVPDNDEEEETSAEEQLEEKLEEFVEHAEGVWARLKTRSSRLHARVKSTGSHIRSSLSTVASVNWAFILIEYALIAYVTWPRTVLGDAIYDPERVAQIVPKELGIYNLILVLPALVFSYVVNFTKKSAIRRKKHVYIVDPILYGLARFFVAALYHFLTTQVLYPHIAGASGLTSALVGIYASVLQTP